MPTRHLSQIDRFSLIDRALLQFDRALHTLVPGSVQAERPSPARPLDENVLTPAERRHAAGLMRINHPGEVCAQALYQGQALTARRNSVRDAMHHAATEEIDHLAWCEQRLRELDSRPSLLNPLFYGASLAIGAAAGAIGDKVSLGFIAATEDQVCQHIERHLESLPTEEKKSRAILEQMLIDERHHGTAAIAAGGMRFPRWLKRAMTQVSGAMTKTTYYV